jgi:murein DD-endopeptidase MepM/ murein hydrolase activator NlpD
LFIPTLPQIPASGTPTLQPGALASPDQPCIPRSGWTPYVVQRGDTLFGIARRAGIRLAELQTANCIPNASQILIGQVILVPPGSVIAPSTFAPGAPQQPVAPLTGSNVRDCGNPLAWISSPAPGSVVRDVIAVGGSAYIADFNFYKLEIRPETGLEWGNVGTFRSPVENGILGLVDTRLFAPGVYWLQLTVVAQDSNYPPPCAIRIVIGN